MSERIAIIDIGSNSVRYMLSECTSTHVHSLHKELKTTRLAAGQDENNRLQAIPVERTAEAVREFCRLAERAGVPAFAYATSALREASNREALLSRLPKGLPLVILSGAQEGEMAYLGACGGKGTLIDIGGGSFQIVTRGSRFSAPIGCVRLCDRIADGTPKELLDALTPWADGYLNVPLIAERPVTGVGGTITTLGALLLKQTTYDGSALDRATLTVPALERLLDALYAMGADRKKHPLLLQRHSVILHGATILRYLMRRCSIEALTPCDRDGMEGFAMAILSGKISVK